MHSEIYIEKYAVIENEDIKLIVSVEDKQISKDDAEFVLQKMFPENNIVYLQDKELNIELDNIKYIDGKFTQPKPFDSWKWKFNNWVAPKEYPQDGQVYYWDENILNWKNILEEVSNNE